MSRSNQRSHEQRLQKLISQAGIASRRKAEEMIKQNRVKVNGKTATIGQKADPKRDKISIDGQPIQLEQNLIYYRLHKPRGYITAVSDDRDRPVVVDLLPEITQRIYPVGRLDYDSEGVLLLTNDGELAYQLTHPSFQVPRTYHVKVKGDIKSAALRKLQEGVELDDGVAHAVHTERLQPTPGGHTWIEIVLTEGRNREVRRMCDAVGHPVQRLKRIRYANLHVEDLYPGEYRKLSEKDLKELRSFIHLPVNAPVRAKKTS
ncbi:MAG: pseudouridine synthase [Deltaproteobacteria bacterium]|nr:pseudouridine synthase [Deltaproteobacteria bacterium]MBU50353.1 pseudouridine synthase [Deltaproteobacteria bacterium]|tara:strand:- start:86 stop:868 length:783 start_codon:yes stop_codon:yes gene_type:complete